MERNNPIVIGMCSTTRHDWGLDKRPGDLTSGMHQSERDRLYDTMDQLYYHNVRPVIQKLEGELDALTDEVEKLKAERDKLLSDLRFAQDQVQRYQNNGNFY